MTYPADRHAQATLSGRELALKRRQAMALHGKAGSAKPAGASARQRPEMAAAPTAASSQSRPASVTSAAPQVRAASMAASTSAPLNPPQAQLSPARARRLAMSQQGKSAVKQAGNGGASRPSAHLRPTVAVPAASVREASASCGCVAEKSCGCGCADTASTPALSTQSAVIAPAADVSAAVRAVPMAGGRALAQARRAALAQDGKAGLRRVAQATKIAAALPGQDWQTAMSKGATARQVAMQRRHVQSLVGRAGAAAEASRPSGRMKARDTRAAAPVKVEEGHTLSGQRVTGTQVERSQRVSGNEPGS